MCQDGFHTAKCKYWREPVLIVLSNLVCLGLDGTGVQRLNRNISSWQEANKQQHRNTEDYILRRLTDDNKQRGQFNGLCSRKHVLPPDEA